MQTRYAKSGDVNIAYQVVGEGGLDLVLVPGFVSNVELIWEIAPAARFLERLASFSRLILFDKRGTGLSDRVPNDRLPTLEQRMDDVRAVLDAVGSERAALFGFSEGGSMCVLFAATYPERTTALALFGVFAKRLRTDDYPWAPTLENRLALFESVEREWGSFDVSDVMPGADEVLQREFAAYLRRSASPAAAAALLRMNAQIDVREVLPAVSVPALVLHRRGDLDANVEEGRWLAAQIRDARFVELEGDDHIPFVGDQDAILDAVEEFLTGVRPARAPERILATVLFTDIVGSTERLAELGDRHWRELLERHHAAVRAELQRFRGREIDTTGDGFLAVFDGPARAIRCACAVRGALRALGLEVRAGVHTGEVETSGDQVTGIAVHTGARVASSAHAGEVLVSSTVVDLVSGSGIEFEDRGEHALKGVPGPPRRLYAVVE